MQISATPLKWTIPFAANDSAKVEIPATTADPTRFSLSLGSPPLTGQPPESGGVPPQLEDFNGAVNQIARFTWWAMGGGPLPFDATWSADPNVNGYANGAHIATADGRGEWISVADNNTANPDTTGTNWVPGYNYGTLALTGQTGGTVTLTPAQAVKRTFSVAGVLASNLTIILPTWLQDWTVTNTTTGAFSVTVKTAAGSGAIIPQNSSPTRVVGDGTNVTQLPQNIAAATTATHAMQFGQATGRLLRTTVYAIVSGTQQVSVDGGTFSATGATTFSTQALTARAHVIAVGGGAAGGSTGTTGATQFASAGGGGGGGYIEAMLTGAASGITVTVGTAGVPGAAGLIPGGNGGNTTLSGVMALSAGGGSGGSAGTAITTGTVAFTNGGNGGVSALTGASMGAVSLSRGAFGGIGLVLSGQLASGFGGGGYGGGGGGQVGSTANGSPASGPGGGGGGGGGGNNNASGQQGGAGAAGIIIIREYA